MRLSSTILLLIGLLLFACKQPQIPDSSPVIVQQATPCFGACPVYTISIYENRVVSLKAERFVKLQGNFTASLSQKDYERLIEKFENSVFDFKDKYTAQLTDMPTIHLTFNHKGREKKIMDYYGAPDELKNLEAEVYALIDKLKWKKAR